MITVGCLVVAGKLIVEVFPVFFAAGARLVIGSLILVPLLIHSEGGFPRMERRNLLVLFFPAFTGVFLFSVFLLFGLRFKTAAESGIITSTTSNVIAVSIDIERGHGAFERARLLELTVRVDARR